MAEDKKEMEEETIPKNLAALYIDVYCWSCKKLCALSNTVEIEGRRFCYHCGGIY